MTAVATRTEARISGEISGQVAVGDHIIQNNVAHGGVVYNMAPGEAPRSWRRPSPSRRPRRAAPLLGRQREVESALARLAEGTPVELVGPGGIGKTSLLKDIVQHAPASTGVDGVVYHEAHNEVPEDTLQYLFETFYETNVPFKPNAAQIEQALKDIAALVVLDDVPADREGVTRVLDTLPSANLLFASSRRCLWGSGTSIALRGLPRDAAVALVERELGRSLDGDELEAARTIADAMDGHPLRLLQVAALVSELGESLRELADDLDRGAPAERLADLLRETLDDDQRKVLGLLSALGGDTLPADQLAAITGVAAAGPVLESLMRKGLVQAHSPRYSVTAPGDAAPGGRPGGDWTGPAADHLTSWVEANASRPVVVLEDAAAVLTAVRLAADDQRWQQVLRLGRACEGPLLLGRRWGAWREVLLLELTAAQRLGDRAAEGWARHQLGSRALTLGDHGEARRSLTSALSIREALGDDGGAAATRHNLALLASGGHKPADAMRTPPAALGLAGPLLGLPFGFLVGIVALLGVIVGAIAVAVSRPPPRVVVESAASATLSADPSRLSFGSQALGTSSSPQALTVAGGGAATRIAQVALTGGAQSFHLDDRCTGTTIPRGATCSLSVVFAPLTTGAHAASLVVTRAGGDTLSIPLTGTGTGPGDQARGLRLEPASVDFGPQALGTASAPRRVSVENTAASAVDLRPAAIGGGDASDFSVRSTCGARLAAGQSCTLNVTFRPRATGARVAALTVATSGTGAGDPVGIGLAGTGEGAPPPPPPPVANFDLQVPASLTLAYGSPVGPLTTTARPGAGVTLTAGGVPEGVSFTQDGRGSGRFEGTALAAPGPAQITVTATAGGATTTRSFTLTITPADLSLRWALPLLDISPGSPPTVKAVVVLPPGNQGDLTRAQVFFDVRNLLGGPTTAIGPLAVSPSGAVAMSLAPGQLPAGSYIAQARLAPGNRWFNLLPPLPTAILVNTDPLGVVVYAAPLLSYAGA